MVRNNKLSPKGKNINILERSDVHVVIDWCCGNCFTQYNRTFLSFLKYGRGELLAFCDTCHLVNTVDIGGK